MAQKAVTGLTADKIALTEKKVDMTLDDIIKMSRKAGTKGKMPPRPPIKNRGLFPNNNAPQGNVRAQRYMDSRSSIRQGVLAQRRSNFRGNQFPLTTEYARKAVNMPIRNLVVNNRPRAVAMPFRRKASDGSSNGKDKLVAKQRPQTLDARFADMKEQRMRAISQDQRMRAIVQEQRMRALTQQMPRGNRRQAARRQRGPTQWGRGATAPTGTTMRGPGNFVR